MKIIIGTNTFGKYHRQDVAVESWKHLSDVKLVNVQFEDEKDSFNVQYDMEHVFTLTRSSMDTVDKSTKKLPYINDILDVLSRQDCDYFIYTNNDVIINKNLIKYISENKPACMSCSRLDIHDVHSFDIILEKKITPVRYEIAGFDTFIFSKDWYELHKDLFRDYLVGQPHWDQVYAGLMKMHGGDLFGNNFPPYCFHIHHEATWQNIQCVERNFNSTQLSISRMDCLAERLFNRYLTDVLIKRLPRGTFMNPVTNEKLMERNFWRIFL